MNVTTLPRAVKPGPTLADRIQANKDAAQQLGNEAWLAFAGAWTEFDQAVLQLIQATTDPGIKEHARQMALQNAERVRAMKALMERR